MVRCDRCNFYRGHAIKKEVIFLQNITNKIKEFWDKPVGKITIILGSVFLIFIAGGKGGRR